jgi:hypothetical protein
MRGFKQNYITLGKLFHEKASDNEFTCIGYPGWGNI